MEQTILSSKKSGTTTSVSNEAALWGRLLEPAQADLSTEAAHYLLSLHFPQSDLERMRELAEKARQGTHANSESSELDIYEQVGHALSLMKSKARRTLKQVGKAA